MRLLSSQNVFAVSGVDVSLRRIYLSIKRALSLQAYMMELLPNVNAHCVRQQHMRISKRIIWEGSEV